MPKVYLIREQQPNAFATGRNPENAAVAATSGILQLLDRDELEGVIAHELAHIKNRDILTMTVAATVAGAISMLAQFGFFFGGGRNRDNGAGVLGVMLAVIFAPLAAMLIQMTISRTREYSADRDGAEISGKPLALASALAKISAYAQRIPMPTAERNPTSAPLFIINPLSGQRMDNLFSTHPKVENRIRALEAMGGGSRGVTEPDPRMPDAAEPDPRRPPALRVAVPGLAARRAAAGLLAGVLERRLSLGEQAEAADGPLAALAPSERARAQALAAGTLRHLGRIDAVLAPFLRKPPPGPAMAALRLAVAELNLDRVPAHAAVDGAVRLAQAGKGRHAAGLVNAVARRVAEGGAALWGAAPEAPLPGWLAEPVAAAWGEDVAAAIAEAHRRAAPIDLTEKRREEDWAARLGAERLPTGSLRLAGRGQVSALPGYDEGAWWVQDAAAALPVRLLGEVAGRRALDVCAAPGGKTLQLAAGGAEVTALDLSEARLGRLRQNLARTGLRAEVVAADALEWAPEAAFDAIVVDAPCSASGTIRRHPDLPHLRTGRELGALVALQAALTRAGLGLARARGAARLLRLLAHPGRGRGAGGWVSRRDAGGAGRRAGRGGARGRAGVGRPRRRAEAPARLLAGAGRNGRLLRRLPGEAGRCRVTSRHRAAIRA